MNAKQRAIAKINMAFVLTDIAESYLLEVEQYLGESGLINSEVKEDYLQARGRLHKLVMSVKDENDATYLGELSDIVRGVVDSIMKESMKS